MKSNIPLLNSSSTHLTFWPALRCRCSTTSHSTAAIASSTTSFYRSQCATLKVISGPEARPRRHYPWESRVGFKTKVRYELFIPRLQSFIFNNRMDLHEDREKNAVTPSFEFPGSTKENVQLEIQNGRLTVSAENTILEVQRGWIRGGRAPLWQVRFSCHRESK